MPGPPSHVGSPGAYGVPSREETVRLMPSFILRCKEAIIARGHGRVHALPPAGKQSTLLVVCDGTVSPGPRPTCIVYAAFPAEPQSSMPQRWRGSFMHKPLMASGSARFSNCSYPGAHTLHLQLQSQWPALVRGRLQLIPNTIEPRCRSNESQDILKPNASAPL